MTESVRSVKVHIEVETNKDTYTLYETGLDLDQVQDAVRAFIEDTGICSDVGDDAAAWLSETGPGTESYGGWDD